MRGIKHCNIVDDPADPLPFVLADLDVHLAMTHNSLQEVAVVLIAPDGTIVPLFLNGIDIAGQAIQPPQGITGTDLGVAVSGNARTTLETVFDDDAPRLITDPGAAPGFIAHFAPE